MTHAPKPGPGPHTVVPATDLDFNERVRHLLEAGTRGTTTIAQLAEAFGLASDALTPNEQLLHEIFAAPACAAVDMGLGCTEAATWTAELTCCHLRELCCDAHHTNIAASRRDVICNNCATPGRMGRLVDFTPYAGTTR